MTPLLDDFLELIEEEIALFQELLLILQKEREAIVDSNIEELNESSKKKESLLLAIRILEEKRLIWLDRLAEKFGFSPQDLTLSKLSQLLDIPYSNRLQSCSSNLTAIIQSIQEINQTNEALLKHSLDLVRGSLTLLNNLMVTNPVYHRTGKIQKSSQCGQVLSAKF